jgi:N-glycosylase/DNA lyase
MVLKLPHFRLFNRLSMSWHTLLHAVDNKACCKLNLEYSLTNGQSFGWNRVVQPEELPASKQAVSTATPAVAIAGAGSKRKRPVEDQRAIEAAKVQDASVVWRGVLGQHVVSIRHISDAIEFQTFSSTAPDGSVAASINHHKVAIATPAAAVCGAGARQQEAGVLSLLHDYFQLGVDMQALYPTWGAADERMKAICSSMQGMRILRQDPWECLISFICSSNNNIQRITQMLSKLRIKYGSELGEIDGTKYYAFPTVEQLCRATEGELRDLGFGYRAKFITKTAARVLELGGSDFLTALRSKDRVAVQDALVELEGVGRKVADCVALFSLDQVDCIPVDTHMWNIACRYMDPGLLASKSLTPKIYNYVGDCFRKRYVERSGWAHSLLFAAELPVFHKFLPPALVADMASIRAGEKEKKTAASMAKRAKNGKSVKSESETESE